MFRRHQQQRQRQHMGLFLLAYQMMNAGPIPPVTLATILAQVAIFLDFVPKMGPDYTRSLCLIPTRIFKNKEYLRLIAPVFMHADDMHLYYNMASMLWKGRRIEHHLGSVKTLVIIAVFAVTTACMTVAVSMGLDSFGPTLLPNHDFGYSYQCGVGFSGVLFALKVLCNKYFPHDNALLLGWLPIPSRYACWAELVLIQLITPNASFVGHLAGILVGLLYTMGPLEMIVDTCCSVISPIIGGEFQEEQPYANANTNDNWGNGETVGRGERRNRWSEYTGGMSEEEQLLHAQRESMRQRRGYGWN